jgi:hypothetical protein
VASSMEQIKWNAFGKGVTCNVFYFNSQRGCVAKSLTGFIIDSVLLRESNLFVYSPSNTTCEV